MTYEQIFLFSLLGVVFAFLVWGRIRYDLVAFAALIIAVAAGVVDAHDAFIGFGHEAVVIIALVLIVSRAMMNAGAVELIARFVLSSGRSLSTHIGFMSVIGAGLSAVINNVAALVMLMTLDIEAAKKAKRPVSRSLMSLSFATILGGMITLIGTPPNIVIAEFRGRALGESFSMFDFSPVGLVCAVVGIAFVTLVGWRLIPETGQAVAGDDGEAGLFVVEAGVKEKSKFIDGPVSDLYPLADEHDVTVLGLVRRGKRLPGFSAGEELRKSDQLILEGDPKSIEAFIGAAELDTPGSEEHGGIRGKSLVLVEAIVPDNARMVGRTALDLRLLYRRGVTLLGVSRQGRRFRERVRKLPIRAGDVVLLLGPESRVADAADWLGVLPLAEKSHNVIQRGKALFAVAVFAIAVAISVMGFVPLAIALAGAVAIYALFNVVGAREVYESVEWPVIVLLASLIPLGLALEESGGTKLIADSILSLTGSLPAWAILAILMVVTMTLSDFLNNVATALIAAPVGLSVAQGLNVSPDPFLMGVAVAASCAFLTPIGHKNNTIIMGPGGYRFGDYWRMGLPLEILIIAVSVPAILFFWPL
ncbi:SLC13 family permease [Nitratireductor aquimarinus]|uniref:SLC13 family permease n=1 Tax=Alphaproteobacteria TaxID=28211 RepID=UPI0019D36C7D|nr:MULTISPECIES: SLC13 family permease [Alphaproteobacteria]MBY6020181.1 SLC13 family permease [Nitratireductor sp. DP7N14-4]MBN7755399.1 SLC13 family permease [Nitratireductor aquimarinus]MBN7775880.1 SLC13 family permease [Nitratireductor pacificus]MBN7780543.1 SLC13 family permease [Nitratireductor pacificus]MBN7789350.1 SLC13 family permease [Nitratireductor aquimarinus]